MSVTVEDLLQLPSLRRAKVLGGHKGLSKIVSSISVLESVDPGILIDELFPRGEYFGSEIVITSFMNILEDVEGQCANIRRMAQGGGRACRCRRDASGDGRDYRSGGCAACLLPGEYKPGEGEGGR